MVYYKNIDKIRNEHVENVELFFKCPSGDEYELTSEKICLYGDKIIARCFCYVDGMERKAVKWSTSEYVLFNTEKVSKDEIISYLIANEYYKKIDMKYKKEHARMNNGRFATGNQAAYKEFITGEFIYALHILGLSNKTIADALCISRTTVYNRLKKYKNH